MGKDTSKHAIIESLKKEKAAILRQLNETLDVYDLKSLKDGDIIVDENGEGWKIASGASFSGRDIELVGSKGQKKIVTWDEIKNYTIKKEYDNTADTKKAYEKFNPYIDENNNILQDITPETLKQSLGNGDLKFKDNGREIMAAGEKEKMLVSKFQNKLSTGIVLYGDWDAFCDWVQGLFPDKLVNFEIEQLEGELDEMMGVGFAPERSEKRRQNYIGQHHSPQAPQSQAALQENTELRKLIRESFDQVFNYRQITEMLQETSVVWAAKLKPQQKERVDKMVNDAVSTGANKNFYWQIGKSGAAHLSNEEQNYGFDLLVEGYLKTKDLKYKRAIYSFWALSPDLVSYLYHRLNASTSLESLAKDQDTFNEKILERVLFRIFMGGKVQTDYTTNRAANSPMVDFFENMMTHMKPDSKTFGSYFMNTIYQWCRDLIEQTIKKGENAISLNAPSRTTGKETDLGNPDDMGSDEWGTTDDNSEEDMLSSLSGEPEEAGKARDKMYKGNTALTIEKLNAAFRDIIRTAGSVGIFPDKTLPFEETVLNYKSPEEIQKEYSHLYKDKQKVSAVLNALKTDPKFMSIAEDVLKKYGFPNVVKTMQWAQIQRLGKELKASAGKEKTYHENPKPDERYVYEQALAESIKRIKARLIISSLKNQA